MSFRDVPDWDPEPEVDDDVCSACRRGQFGCTCYRPEEEDAQPEPRYRIRCIGTQERGCGRWFSSSWHGRNRCDTCHDRQLDLTYAALGLSRRAV